MNNWKKYKVEEFADVIGGGTPKTEVDEYWNGDIPWITPKDLSDNKSKYIPNGERYISSTGLSNSSARLIPKGSVLLTSRAPVGYLAIANNNLTTNQGFRSLVAKDGFNSEFIYYLLLENVDFLKQHASGSTFPELSGGTVKGLEFFSPPSPRTTCNSRNPVIHRRQNRTEQPDEQNPGRNSAKQYSNSGL